jgi:hypothetical protein
MIPENVSPLALAMEGCRCCAGLGQLRKRRRPGICACVYRRVFRACSGKYWELRQHDGDFARRVTLERTSYQKGQRRGLSAGFKAAEYLADFELVARKTLRDMPLEYAVFRYHCLHRLPWPACFPWISRNLGQPVSRGNFFHAVYRMEETLGRAFLELRPYSLVPREYFSGCYVHLAAVRFRSGGNRYPQLAEPPAGEMRSASEVGSCQFSPEKVLAAHAA